VIPSEPSFGVFKASVVGNVKPPSTESFMLTLAEPTNALEPFTVHVIVCEVLEPAYIISILGCNSKWTY
jgi:hypothetical protein